MSFLNPILAAVGLLSVALPIVIHILFRRRRRPVEWGAMRFLQQAYQRQRQRMRFEQWLLLAARCILVAALALAVGRPMLGAAARIGGEPSRTVYLLIDNSVASAAVSASGRSGLDRFKEAALEELKQLSAGKGDRVAVIALAGPAEALIAPPVSDLSGAAELINSLRVQDSRADLRGALQLVSAAETSQPEGVEIRVLSDLRAGSLDIRSAAPVLTGLRTPRLVYSEPDQSPLSNVGVQSVELLQPLVVGLKDQAAVQQVPFRVTLARSGAGLGNAETTPVTLDLAPVGPGEKSQAFASVAWTPGQETASVLLLASPAPRSADAPAQDYVATAFVPADRLPQDDRARTVARARSRLDIIILDQARGLDSGAIETYSPTEWLSLALAPQAEAGDRRRLETDLRVTVLDPAQASTVSAIGGADAILIPRPQLLTEQMWKRAAEVCQLGSFVLVFPPPDAPSVTWSDEFLRAFGMSWVFSREVISPPSSLRLSSERTIAPDVDPLSLLSAEFEELVKPVNVHRMLPVSGQAGAFDVVLSLQDQSPLIVSARPQSETDEWRGVVAYMSAPLDLAWTDLPTKPLLVPLLQELLRQSVGRGTANAIAVAGTNPPLPRGTIELLGLDGGTSLSVSNQAAQGVIRSSGVFAAKDVSGQTLAHVAMNPDTLGSNVDVIAGKTVQAWFSATGASVEAKSQESGAQPGEKGPARGSELPVSLPLLILAAMAAVSELFMARYFSHARVSD